MRSSILIILWCMSIGHLAGLTIWNKEDKQQLVLKTTYLDRVFTVELCFGEPQTQCFNARLILNRFFTWVPDISNTQTSIRKYNRMDSKEYREKHSSAKITFDGINEVIGRHGSDMMWFGSYKVPYILIMLGSNTISFPDIEGVLSLGYIAIHPEEEYNILDQLISQKLIDHRVFGVSHIRENEGTILFGYIPLNIMNDYHHYGRCKTLLTYRNTGNANRNWECILREITLNSNPLSTEASTSKSTVYFDYSYDMVLVPMQTLLKYESLFEKLISNGECQFGLNNGYYKYTCLKLEYKEVDSAYIIFDDWEMLIPKEKLFVYDVESNKFDLVFRHKNEENTESDRENPSHDFIIGNHLLTLFDMVFDSQNAEIGFYSDKFVNYYSDKEIKKPRQYTADEKKPIPDEVIEVKEENDKPYIPPFQKENYDMIDGVIIPSNTPIRRSFMNKFLITFGSLLLIVLLMFFAWMGFRYSRRKTYSAKLFDYKEVEDILK